MNIICIDFIDVSEYYRFREYKGVGLTRVTLAINSCCNFNQISCISSKVYRHSNSVFLIEFQNME